MTYQVTMTATAIKKRKRLDAASRKRVDATLRNLLENPRPQALKSYQAASMIGVFVSAITAFCMK